MFPYPTLIGGLGKVRATALAAALLTGDAWLNDTILNLRGVGTNGQTTTVDSSPSVKTMTMTNSVISTTQSKFNGSAYYFDGTGDEVTTPWDSEFPSGTADFCIEVWIYPTAVTGASRCFFGASAVGGAAGTQPFTCYIDTNAKVTAYGNTSAGASVFSIACTTSIVVNTWNRVTVTRKGTLFSISLNGVVEGTATNSGSLTSTATVVSLGSLGNAAFPYWFSGYASHLRVTRGARFPTSHKNPTTEYSSSDWYDGYWNDTIMHLDMDGSNGATTVTDRSIDANSWTFQASATISTAQSYLGASSLYCPSSQARIETNDFANLDIGTGDFCFECDIRLISVNLNGTYIWGQSNSTGSLMSIRLTIGGTGAFGGNFTDDGSTSRGQCTGTTVAALNTWYRVIYQRRAGVCSLIVNGAEEASVTAAQAVYNSSSKFAIGRLGEYTGATGGGVGSTLDGYVANFRAAVAARYVAPIIRPRILHPRSEGERYPWHKVLQLAFEGADASTALTDLSNYARTMTVNGNAQIDTAQFKFDTSSGLFDGNGDAWTTPDAAELTLGTNDFTLKLQFRLVSAAGGDYYFIGQCDSAAAVATRNFTLLVSSAVPPKLQVYGYDGSSNNFLNQSGTTTIAATTWYEGTIIREGSNFYLCLDGVVEGSPSSATAFRNSADVLGIGSWGAYIGASKGNVNGWMDDVAMYVGIALHNRKHLRRRQAHVTIGW